MSHDEDVRLVIFKLQVQPFVRVAWNISDGWQERGAKDWGRGQEILFVCMYVVNQLSFLDPYKNTDGTKKLTRSPGVV